jgi:hypothetical protein
MDRTKKRGAAANFRDRAATGVVIFKTNGTIDWEAVKKRVIEWLLGSDEDEPGDAGPAGQDTSAE